MIMGKSMNNHMWYGLLSTYTTKFGENFDFYGGIDLRYYKGLHQNVIVDLFGGDYFIDAEIVVKFWPRIIRQLLTPISRTRSWVWVMYITATTMVL